MPSFGRLKPQGSRTEFGVSNMAGIVGPPIIPTGITNALGTFEQHLQLGPPIDIILGNPVIPGNPVFGDGPASHIIGALFGEAPTVDVLGITDLHHDFFV
jgi:hypothetical protein